MCIKEFFGFACGHCSIPSIRQCPLAFQNPEFPFCSLPAERPLQLNEFCHGCARASWNMRVLEKEAEHKKLHELSRCQCEVIFTDEDRRRQGIWAIAPRDFRQGPHRQHHVQQTWSLHDARGQQNASLKDGDTTSEEGSSKSYIHDKGNSSQFHPNGRDMTWYPGESQNQVLPFNTMRIGAEAVLRARGPLGVPTYPFSPKTRGNTYSYTAATTSVSIDLPVTEENSVADRRPYPTQPMVISSTMNETGRSISAPPN